MSTSKSQNENRFNSEIEEKRKREKCYESHAFVYYFFSTIFYESKLVFEIFFPFWEEKAAFDTVPNTFLTLSLHCSFFFQR